MTGTKKTAPDSAATEGAESEVTRVDSKRSVDPCDYFVKLHTQSCVRSLGGLAQLKKVTLADLGALIALASFGTPKSYRIRATVKQIAEQYGTTESGMSNRMAKLKAADLIALRKDAHGFLYYVIEPDVIGFNGNPRSYEAARREIDEAAAERRAKQPLQAPMERLGRGDGQSAD